MNKPVNAYKVNAFDVIKFKLIREKDDFDTIEAFKPDMTHQIFGESEIIFGYKNLNITIAYMAGSLSTFVDIEYSEKIPSSVSDGVEPHNILEALKNVYPEGFYTDKSEFLNTFEQELSFKPFGKLLSEYATKEDGQLREFVIYYVDPASEDFKAFSEYLMRMEPFLLFFVDESRFIELDDRWSFYVMYEKYSSASSPKKRFAFAGYASVYKFYAYPEHMRPRLSQLVILPPFQKMGNATRLLEAIYENLTPLPEVIDITIESPSDDLTSLRDYLDSKRCLNMAECVKILKSVKQGVARRELDSLEAKTNNVEDEQGSIDAPPSSKRRRLSAITTTPAESRSIKVANNFYQVVRQQLKLSRKQSRRIYQILLYFVLTHNNPGTVESFRRALIRRIRIVNGRPRIVSRMVESSTSRYNLITDLFNEEYEREEVQQVDAELKAYQKVVDKLEAALKAGEVDIKCLEEP